MTITSADRSILDAPIRCSRSGCRGSVLDVSLRMARALLEYGLRKEAAFRLAGNCSVCSGVSWYTYSDVIN